LFYGEIQEKINQKYFDFSSTTISTVSKFSALYPNLASFFKEIFVLLIILTAAGPIFSYTTADSIVDCTAVSSGYFD